MLKRQMRIVMQRPWLRVAISFGFILLLSITLVGLHVRAYPKLSPIDELQHIDALYRASHGEIVRRGQLVGQEAMGEEACRGIDALFRPPPCGGPYQPSRFQEAGINTADIHPPTYYFATVGVADLLRAVGLASNLVDAGRLVGALWLGLGLMA